ncbi:MAG: DUF4197 domain-containing protein [Bacteroidia bacterium]|nr:DUF4197 domain-containing protein [Bacteroidia bacterium]
MKKIQFILMFCLTISVSTVVGCTTLMQAAGGAMNQSSDPSPTKISEALKEALNKGLGFAVNKLGAQDGFWGDMAVKILFPPEAQFAAEKLRQIGLGNVVDDFELKMNRGAEDAVKEALPIFTSALTSMSFQDVKNILLGSDPNAATNFFKAKTSDALYNAFAPKIKGSLDKTGAANAWTKVTTTYNAIPLVNRKVETDIVRYATNKAMDGLFKKVSEEEAKIRQNPIFRTTQLLKDVFGYADRMRSSGNTGNTGGKGGSSGSSTNTKGGSGTGKK